MKHLRIGAAQVVKMMTTIDHTLFKVCYKLGPTSHRVTERTMTGVCVGEDLRLTLSLPVYTAMGDLWAAVGQNSEGDLMGFNAVSPIVRRIPMMSGTSRDGEDLEIINVSLTSSGNYDVLFGEPAESIIEEEGILYYNICAIDTDNGGVERMLKLAVRCGNRRETLDIRNTPERIGRQIIAATVPVRTHVTISWDRPGRVRSRGVPSTPTRPPRATPYRATIFSLMTPSVRGATGPIIPRRRAADLEAVLSPAQPITTTECPICLILMNDDQQAMWCTHTFCRACIMQWLSTSFTCPVCRAYAVEGETLPAPIDDTFAPSV